CDQVIRKTIGVAIQVHKGHAPCAVGQRHAFRESARRALEQIADRDPTDTVRPRHTTSCFEIGHACPPSLPALRGANWGPREARSDDRLRDEAIQNLALGLWIAWLRSQWRRGRASA